MASQSTDPKGQNPNLQKPFQEKKGVLSIVGGFVDRLLGSDTPQDKDLTFSESQLNHQPMAATDDPKNKPSNTSSVQHSSKLPSISTNKMLPRSVFTVEILVTAGPRKSISDYNNPAQRELGEDAAGACYLENNLIFWLADGTSDQSSLYDLSARGLAQSLGNEFVIYIQNWLYRKNPNEPFDISHVFKAVEEKWLKRLKFWIKGADEETRKRIWDIFQERKDNARMLEWSTTFLGGIISYADNEDKLLIVNYGDTVGLYIDSNQSIHTIDRNSSKFAIRAIWSDLNAEPYTEILVKNKNPFIARPVNNVIFMTDGNSKQSPDALLKDLKTKASQGDVFNDPVALVKKMREYSMDDRAVVICQKVNLT